MSGLNKSTLQGMSETGRSGMHMWVLSARATTNQLPSYQATASLFPIMTVEVNHRVPYGLYAKDTMN